MIKVRIQRIFEVIYCKYTVQTLVTCGIGEHPSFVFPPEVARFSLQQSPPTALNIFPSSQPCFRLHLSFLKGKNLL